MAKRSLTANVLKCNVFVPVLIINLKLSHRITDPPNNSLPISILPVIRFVPKPIVSVVFVDNILSEVIFS